jgi:acetyltransferase-like isoleucine patch superfamily enzyme
MRLTLLGRRGITAATVRRDHRPYYLKRAMASVSRWWVRHFLAPHFDVLGPGADIRGPGHVEVIGRNIRAGRNLSILATRDKPVRLVVYPTSKGRIDIGDHVALSPGVRLTAHTSIVIGDSCSLAQRVFVTDADWHDLYDRVFPPGPTAPVVLEENVWIGDGAIVCKGVRIGRNSVVGAGSVVVRDVPPNTVVAGNPAREVKQLDPTRGFTTRRDLFTTFGSIEDHEDRLDREELAGNTLLGWLRAIWLPDRDV